MNRTFALVLLALVAASPTFSFAGDADWPQWRGPNRDGHAAPQSLLQSWPDDGPELVWSAKNLGTGYSTVAVVGSDLYTMGTKDDQAMVLCLSTQDGSLQWETEIGPAGKSGDYSVGWGAGQRGTPTVDQDQVFVLSDLGTVAALDRKSGKLQWSVDLVETYGGKVPNWGYSESPLVDGNRVIVTPGGANFMVGLDRRTGDKVWQSNGVEAPAQYVSVKKGSVGDMTYYVTASKPGLYGFDVQSGEKLFEDSVTGNDVAVIPTPVIEGDLLYHTSAYGAGNTLLSLVAGGGDIKPVPVYALNTKSMENHHGGVVLVDGVIYGFTKESGGNWMAQDFKTGETLWMERVRPNRSGSICYADGRLYCYNDTDGTVSLVEPSREGFKPQGKLTLPAETELPRGKGAIWTHPVVAGGKLIIRDQDLMYAYDIAK